MRFKVVFLFINLLGFLHSEALFAGFNFSIEGDSAVFFPQSSRVRGLFKKMLFVRSEMKIPEFFWVHPFLGFGYVFADGKSLRGKKTELYLIPGEIGALCIFSLHRFRPYFAAGACISYNHLNQKAMCGPTTQTSWSYGGVLKSGLYFYPKGGFFLNAFFSYYLFLKTEFSPEALGLDYLRVDLSGASAGGGIGYFW